ncbi:DUF4397 domain-containing protein [Bacillus sp. B1-b2]|uniref:DUF4397 domain-containing protein n=1 Tax=Bacillus sp. B1-b2 TaxID=2653201 RepID=UPI0012621751|nr:DUF4397 domain-containing protein [Bacillus sp. B1-b2]KAB7673028.1 DUF4397 domain-containing protein [Bacillus sp. B1-b2]
MVSNDSNSVQEAGMYNMLSDYYKYINPELHVYYYHKHIQSLQHAFKKDTRLFSETDIQRQTEYGKIRVLHGSSSTPKVDIYINGMRIFKDITYKSMSNDFTLIAGMYQVDIYEAGKMVDSLCSQKVKVEANRYQTISFSKQSNSLKILSFVEDTTIPANETKLRFVHLASSQSVIDVAVKKGDIVFPKLSCKTASNFLGLYPMTVMLEIRNTETKEIIAELSPLTLEANKGYSAYILDSDKDSTSIELVIFSIH